MASVPEMKSAARARVRARRTERSAAEIVACAKALAAHATSLLPADTITASAYRSMALEPGTAPLIRHLLDRGDRVLLPRIVGRSLEWIEADDGTEFARGPLGIMEPTGPPLPSAPSPLASADILFVPGLSVDRTGRRLGQGGGYYDSALLAVRPHAEGGPLRVAVLFDDEFVDHVPYDEHDCIVDVVLTPTGVAHLSA